MNNTYKTNKTDWRRLGRSILFVALLLAAAPAVNGQVTNKLGKPISGLYNTALTAAGTDVVVLNDLENHTWSYYTADFLPTHLHSLNPADVTIKYFANGTGTISTTNGATPANNSWTQNATGVQLSNDESANTFIYYKTLERTDGSTSANPSGRCAYTTIPNPFCKRPTYQYATGNLNKYCGFYAWRVKSISGGAIYTAATGGAEIVAGGTINAETEVFFAPTSSTGMEVELEALWARAYVKTGNANTLDANNTLNSDLSADSYERNFFVITSGNTDNAINRTQKPVTISCRYPDGTSGGSLTSRIQNNFTANATTKFEFVVFRGGTYNYCQTITGNGYGIIMGRGITGYNSGICAGTIYGRNSDASSAVNYTLRIESGRYTNFYLTGESRTFSSTVSAKCVLGSDYDRATGVNTNLYIANGSGNIYGGTTLTFSGSANRNNLTFDWLVKSGTFHNNILGNASSGDKSIYLGSSQANNGNLQYIGKRRITIEGGDIASIAGAMNNQSTNYSVNDGGWAVMIRMKGGALRGSIYGAAGFAWAVGDRTMVFTGGTINGWVAGGCNGTQTGSGGTLDGDTKLYIGGDTKIVHTQSDPTIATSKGGNVFGAGSGYSADYEIGEVNNTTLVLADNAEVSRGIYGGGNFGYVGSGHETNIYVLGGKAANVFGGANQRFGQTVNIFMDGGLITDGLYGGSNVDGTINNDVTIQINGGQVGTSSSNGNIHGGGYGSATRVSGNIDITLGASNQTEPGVTVYGDVYGGSAMGYVNGTSVNTNHHTNVTLNACDIHGSVYGGGLGDNSNSANVYSPVHVAVYGGSVTGGVYGCNNVKGAPQSTVAVDVYGTDAAPSAGSYAINQVFGGGNQADYGGTPVVTVHCTDANKDISVGEIYGGGNQADVAGTRVVVGAGNIIGDVYGGGRQADVSGNTVVNVNGGTVRRVFGGNNISGTISGTISVTANKTTACPMMIGELYGGGNEAASQAGSISIGCTGDITAAHHAVGADNGTTPPSAIGYTLEGIGDVYGGANNALVTGDITLNINSGMIYRVFGGNNTGNTVSGDITVNVAQGAATCGWYVGYVYGGGNNAAYSNEGNAFPAVNHSAGKVTYNVYGGGKGYTATVTSNPKVILSGTAQVGGNVFGGGNAAPVVGNPTVLLKD